MRNSIKTIREGLLKKDFSVKELVQSYLKSIDEKDKELNAFLEVFANQALEQAEKVDLKSSPLAGIPIVLKDNILVQGETCSAGSKMLKDYKASYNATIVDKLKDAQAIILGKTNLDEFACGASGEHSAFGATKNPHNLKYVPGGSSSGSAAAVAADMACCALGSDTAGSVRLPASFCGVVGFKPTYGAVSRYGLIAMASSFDQIGPIAKSVEDIETIFEVIKGKDKMDSTSLEVLKGEAKALKDLTIGLPKEVFSREGIDKEILKKTNEAVKKLEAEGVHFEEIEMPHLEYGVACYYIITPAELSSNLARYEGIKYGSSKEGKDLIDVYFQTRGEFFGKEIKRRIMLGTYVLSSGYYDAYYLRALKVRSKIIEDFDNSFKKVDFVLAPTSSFLPFKIGKKIDDPLSMYLADLLTVPANLAGLPAISLPAGKVKDMPIGIQLIAPALEDEKLLKTAKIIEKLWIQ